MSASISSHDRFASACASAAGIAGGAWAGGVAGGVACAGGAAEPLSCFPPPQAANSIATTTTATQTF